MSDYPEFNSVPKCKMCGYEPLYEGEESFPMRYIMGYFPKPTPDNDAIEEHRRQHPDDSGWYTYKHEPYRPPSMKRTCPCCGYQWYERTLEDEEDNG